MRDLSLANAMQRVFQVPDPAYSCEEMGERWLVFTTAFRLARSRQGRNWRRAIAYHNPDRKPVIFVHGLLSSKYIWRNTALAFW